MKIRRPVAVDPLPAPAPVKDAPPDPAPAATEGTFYSMLDMLGRQAPVTDAVIRPDKRPRR